MSSSRPLDNPSPVVLQNPNPSVHQTSSTVGATRRTGARDEKALLKDLWASSSSSSGDRSSSGDEDETDEVEEQLDADEVFGERRTNLCDLRFMLTKKGVAQT